MRDYEDFINKYSNKFIGPLLYNEYINIKSYISKELRGIIAFNNFKIDNFNAYVEFIMYHLLSEYYSKDIVTNGYEDEIEEVFLYAYNRNKQRVSSTKGLNKVKDALKTIKPIFDSSVNTDELAYKIYESVKFDGYTDEDIIKGNVDDAIIGYVRDMYFDIKFNPEFDKFRKSVISDSSTIIARNKIDLLRNDPDSYKNNKKFYFYNDNNFQRDIGFKAALTYYLMGKDISNIDMNELNQFIDNYINREIIKANSLRPKNEPRSQRYVAISREEQEEIDERKRKSRIIWAIIIAAFIIDNLIYKYYIKEQKEKPEEDHKPKITHTASYDNDSEITNLYDYENNEYSLGGDTSAKL